MQAIKRFFIGLFTVRDPLIDNQPDERIRNEAHAEYARVYFLFIALIVVGTVVQLFFTRHIVAFLPAIVGGGGSLLYFFYMYRREGLLSKHTADERVKTYKAEVKSRCYNFCLAAYVLLALPLIFFDLHPAAFWVVIGSWSIPTGIAVIRLTKRGLYAPADNKDKRKSTRKEMRKSVAMSSVIFGVSMSLFTVFFIRGAGDFDSVLNLILVFLLGAVLSGAVWGVLFYFAMLGTDKISEKFGKKRGEKEEAEE